MILTTLIYIKVTSQKLLAFMDITMTTTPIQVMKITSISTTKTKGFTDLVQSKKTFTSNAYGEFVESKLPLVQS
jgi:hypothetical protein